MAKEDCIVLRGLIVDLLPAATFKVQIDNGDEIIAYLSGKMRQHSIKISLGDLVDLEVSPYDFSKGRIIYRQS